MTDAESSGRPLVAAVAPIKRPWAPEEPHWNPYVGKKRYVIISAYITPGVVQSQSRPLLLTCKRRVGKSWEYTTPGKLVVGVPKTRNERDVHYLHETIEHVLFETGMLVGGPHTPALHLDYDPQTRSEGYEPHHYLLCVPTIEEQLTA